MTSKNVFEWGIEDVIIKETEIWSRRAKIHLDWIFSEDIEPEVKKRLITNLENYLLTQRMKL